MSSYSYTSASLTQETLLVTLPNYIRTYTGGKFWPLQPKPEDVRIEDIAHALANQCRFSGHTIQHYSVAQHSWEVSKACSPVNYLAGLLHDAAEAYLVDLPSPVKAGLRAMGVYIFDRLEEEIRYCIFKRFGLPLEIPDEVHEMDLRVLSWEKRDLLNAPAYEEKFRHSPYVRKLTCWTPSIAETLFLSRFKYYYKGE